MSRRQQLNFLRRLDAELSKKKANKVYRREVANRQFHNFSLDSKDMVQGVLDFVEKEYAEDFKKLKKVVTPAEFIQHNNIDTAIDTFVNKVKTKINNLPADGVVKEPGWDTGGRIRVGFEFQDNDVYRKIYGLYQRELEEVSATVAAAIANELTGKDEEIEGKQIVNLSHAMFEGVIEQFIYDTIDAVRVKTSEIDQTTFKRWVESQTEDAGVINLVRDSKKDTASVSVGSSVLNAAEGEASREAARELKNLVKEALEKLRAEKGSVLVELGGSDSFKEKHRKKVVKTVTDPFVKKTKAKVKRENVKPKESVTKVKSKKKGSNAFTANPVLKNRRTSKSAPKRTAKKGAASQPFQMLIGVINNKLPTTVAKNMGPPRLAFRTGRFARSTRITDIATTGKGFPSVGYTYMRGPYETFEVGNRQGSTDRDPRKLIDLSIREIAAEYAIGRFFTRRV